MKKAIILAAAALVALVSCNKPEKFDASGSEVRFTSSFENVFTVKSASLEGKTVRIVAGAPISASTDAAAAGTTLTPETKIYWNAEQTEKTTFVGVYPSNGETAFEIADYNVAPDGGQFPYMEEFLTAVAKDVTPGSVVNLNFTHPFVKIAVNIDNQLEGTPAIDGVAVKDVNLRGTLHLDKGTVSDAVKGSVNATQNDGKFEVIILPQEAAKPVIVVTVGAKAYTFKIGAETDFVAGKSYTASLTLKDNTPVPVPGEEVSFSFSVTDWAAVDTPLEATDITEQWSVIGTVNGTNWDADFPMVKNTETGLLEVTVAYKANDEFKLRKAQAWDVQAGMKPDVSYVGDAAWDGYLDGDNTTNRNIELEAAGEYKLTFNPADYTFTATKTADLPDDPAAPVANLNLYVVSEPAWTNLYVYGWNALTTAAWPGNEVVTKETVSEVEYWKYTASGLAVGEYGIVLSNGAGTQTLDIVGSFVEGANVMYVKILNEQEGGKNKVTVQSTPFAGE